MISLRDALEELEALGYAEEFSAVGGKLRAGHSGEIYGPDELIVDSVVRIDVDADAADQALIYALRARRDGVSGTYVTGYGLEMAEADATIVPRLPHAA